MTAQHEGWVSLGTPADELLLANTLVTGQSFRWRRTDNISSPYDTYTGVIGQRLVQMRQLPDDVQYRVLARSATESPAADAAVLQDYLNLGTSLGLLSQHWAAQDPRYAHVAPALPGCRMLRQDPVECMFQFVCSSNNHISRILGMVERLCSTYGSPLLPNNSCSSSGSGLFMEQQQQRGLANSLEQCLSPGTPATAGGGAATWAAKQKQQQQAEAHSLTTLPFYESGYSQQQPQQQQQQQETASEALPSFYAFPTLEQLAAATEDALRADGFGYRAKYIVGSAQQLLDKPEGGRAWLLGLRDKPYAEAHEALCSLPGVGPKVAACICLFSLDKHDAIPVDTHVWDLATKYYAPHLAKKSLTPKLHAEVQQAFVDRFGPYAGWAHNCLFISELASHRHLLPPGPRKGTVAAVAAVVPSASADRQQQKKRKSLELPVQAFVHTASTAGLMSPAASTAIKQEGSQVAAGVVTPAAAAAGQTAAAGNQSGGVAGRRRRRRPTKKMEEAVAAAAAAAGVQFSPTSAAACAGIAVLDAQV